MIFSIIIISGSTQAVFGQLTTLVSSPNTIIPDPFVDIINPGPISAVCGTGALINPLAQSFIPTRDNLDAIEVEIVSLSLQSVNPVTVNVYDGAGTGGALLDSTSNDDGNFVVNNFSVVRFEFASPILLIPANTYTVEITINDGQSDVDWGATVDNVPGIVELCDGNSFPPNDYVFATYYDPNFGQNGVVGGELLPLDYTSLLLAGLQSSAIWMLPVLAGAAGIGAYYIKTRMNKD